MNAKHFSRRLPVSASSAATSAVATVNEYREFKHIPTDCIHMLTNALPPSDSNRKSIPRDI